MREGRPGCACPGSGSGRGSGCDEVVCQPVGKPTLLEARPRAQTGVGGTPALSTTLRARKERPGSAHRSRPRVLGRTPGSLAGPARPSGSPQTRVGWARLVGLPSTQPSPGVATAALPWGSVCRQGLAINPLRPSLSPTFHRSAGQRLLMASTQGLRQGPGLLRHVQVPQTRAQSIYPVP